MSYAVYRTRDAAVSAANEQAIENDADYCVCYARPFGYIVTDRAASTNILYSTETGLEFVRRFAYQQTLARMR